MMIRTCWCSRLCVAASKGSKEAQQNERQAARKRPATAGEGAGRPVHVNTPAGAVCCARGPAPVQLSACLYERKDGWHIGGLDGGAVHGWGAVRGQQANRLQSISCVGGRGEQQVTGDRAPGLNS